MTSISQPTAPQPLEVPSTEPLKVKVKVAVVASTAHITSTHPPGHPNQIAQYMPNRRLRDRVQSLSESYGYPLNNCILQTQSQITNEQWANAIAAEIIIRLSNQRPAEVELSTACEGGFLAIGNAVYRMTAVEIAPQSKAMRAVHHRTLEAARVQSDTIIKTANDQATSILNAASAKTIEANQLMADVKRQVGQTPPKWALDCQIPLRHNGSRWSVGFSIAPVIKTFLYEFELGDYKGTKTTKYWDALPTDRPRFPLWLQIEPDGTYVQTSLTVEKGFGCLPHIKTDGACFSLAAAPKTIKSASDLLLFQTELERVMSVVELHSLYCRYEYWHPAIQKAVPTSIAEIVHQNANNLLSRAQYKADHEETTTATKVASETWTAA